MNCPRCHKEMAASSLCLSCGFSFDDATWKVEPGESIVPGMVDVDLDTRGQLRMFRAVPPRVDDHVATTPSEIDWSIFFSTAGLNMAEFRPAESKWTPKSAYDLRAAWEGAYPENPHLPIRIEAAAYHGKAVYFEIIHPWDRPTDNQGRMSRRAMWSFAIFYTIASGRDCRRTTDAQKHTAWPG